MDRLSDRHEHTLDGRLAALGTTPAATVALDIQPDAAQSPAGQHTAWMLVNLLARQEGVIARILLSCPTQVPLRGRVVPRARRDSDLADALIEGAAAIGAVPVERADGSGASTLRLIVGAGPAVPGALRVWGERAWGGISTGELISRDPRSPLPLGPYAAACFASAYVFNTVRVVAGRAPSPESVFYSLWSFETSQIPPTDLAGTGPHDVALALDAVLAGSGAVGCAWLHTVWAAPSLTGRVVVADDDKEGVDLSNLNRCVIFSRESLGRRKASEAKRICFDATVDIVPYDGPVGAVEDRPPLLLSAVDTNRSREAVQGLYPAHLLSASTHGMRAELLRCDPLAGAACLRCFNPPETGTPDDELRRRFLAASTKRQRELADAAGQTLSEAVQWATEGTCGYATDRLMEHMRADETGAGAFAVGFVSVIAGVMLAAQTLKEQLDEGPLAGIVSRAVMQFFDPLARTNAPMAYRREETCAMCGAAAPGLPIWIARREQHLRQRPR